MSRTFFRVKFSNYLGEWRALNDIFVYAQQDIVPTPSPTPTQSVTPTPTTTTNPICPQQVEFSGISSFTTGATGTYNRLFSYTGGTFTGGYMLGLEPLYAQFYTGAFSGDSRTYAVYGRSDGSLYYTLIYNESTGSSIDWYRVFITSGDYVINGGTYVPPFNSFGLNPSPFDEITDGSVYYPRAMLYTDFGTITYPSVCPTLTPFPTSTPTPTNTPTA